MKLIIANWKMYLGVMEATHLAERIRRTLPNPPAKVVLCPSFPALLSVGAVTRRSPYHLGAQDLSSEDRGAATGEVSARDLKELGCSHVIIGHSERRQKMGETDKMVRQKLEAALRAKLHPILCVGETLAERRAGIAKSVVQKQLTSALKQLHPTRYTPPPITIAYEPIWAIGTGLAAKPKDAVGMHQMIREIASKLLPKGTRIRVIYGGSVDPKNVTSFLKEREVEGVLVGGASTRQSFVDIINSVKGVGGRG